MHAVLCMHKHEAANSFVFVNLNSYNGPETQRTNLTLKEGKCPGAPLPGSSETWIWNLVWPIQNLKDFIFPLHWFPLLFSLLSNSSSQIVVLAQQDQQHLGTC